MNYRLSWLADNPLPPINARFRAVRLGKGGIPGQPRPADTVKVVCDFEATGLEGAERGPAIRTVVTASRGRVGGEAAYPVVGQDGWRAIFDIDFADLPPDEDEPIDLRVYVEHDGKAATETLILQLFPSQLREMLAATN